MIDTGTGTTLSYSLSSVGSGTRLAAFDDDGTLQIVARFAAGTRIATPGGGLAVEGLAPGHRVLGAWGEAMRVVWLGHRRLDCARHPRPRDVWPVRVRAHAFLPGMPARDLLQSPDHAAFLAPPGMRPVLVPVRCLINGRSVAQLRRRHLTYWHVELERHAVMLAEGLPCDSYLDTGNRHAFENGEPALTLHPDFTAAYWDAGSPHNRGTCRARRTARSGHATGAQSSQSKQGCVAGLA